MTHHDPSTFVAGSGGHVGRALVARLTEQGARVAAYPAPGSTGRDTVHEASAGVGAETVRVPWEVAALTDALRRLGPGHVFFVAHGGREHVSLVSTLLRACLALDRAPRFVYLSSLGAGLGARLPYLRRRHSAEEAVRRSGLPYTIARPGVIREPGRVERRVLQASLAAVLRPYTLLARALGARQHARRYRPLDPTELAFGLVHAAFNYTTIDRVLAAEELRYDQANRDPHHVPATRRDHRH